MPGRHFGVHPGIAAQLFELIAQPIAQRGQIAHVVERVFDLMMAEGPAAPIGAGFAFLRRFAEQLIEQRTVAGRILVADQSGRDLHVEQPRRPPPDDRQRKTKLFAAGMDDRLVPLGGKPLPKRSRIGHGQRIDDRQSIVRRHLDQTQFRAIRVFRNEFGVESNRVGVGKLIGQRGEAFGGSDRIGGQRIRSLGECNWWQTSMSRLSYWRSDSLQVAPARSASEPLGYCRTSLRPVKREDA